MQNFRSSTTTVIELRFFMKKKMKMKKMKNLRKSCLPVFHTSCDIFIQFFAYSYFFYMFSTLMSLKDRLRLKLKVSLCMAIMLDNPYIHSTTILRDNRLNDLLLMAAD